MTRTSGVESMADDILSGWDSTQCCYRDADSKIIINYYLVNQRELLICQQEIDILFDSEHKK